MAEFWIVNNSLHNQSGSLRIDMYSIASGERVYGFNQRVSLGQNTSKELATMPLPANPYDVIISARLYDDKGELVNRHVDWPQP